MPRLFDPWPVFFKREWKRNWPFLVGFATTGTIITKLTLGLTEEDAKNSPYMQRRNRGSISLHWEVMNPIILQASPSGISFNRGFKNLQTNPYWLRLKLVNS